MLDEINKEIELLENAELNCNASIDSANNVAEKLGGKRIIAHGSPLSTVHAYLMYLALRKVLSVKS